MMKEKEITPVISSPDNKLQIINFVSFRDAFGCYMVEGTLKNISLELDLTAEIKIDYYDSLNMLVDTETDTFTAPKPGATRGFYMVYSGKRRGDVQSQNILLSVKDIKKQY